MSEIDAWLRQQGLEAYVDVFSTQAIDRESLKELSEADLRELGMPIGHRKRFMKALRDFDAPTASSADVDEESATGKRSRPERRQLTVMFCDLVGYTGLSQRLDAEEVRDVLVEFQNACTASIRRFDGFVARYLGDGNMSYFGYPRAHEDDPERAVMAGLATVNAVERINEGIGSEFGEYIAVRVTIATGPVVVGDLIGEGASEESAVIGQTPNLAARLQTVTPVNSVVISAFTQALVGGRFDCVDLGAHEAKGYTKPINAWRVLDESSTQSRFEAIRGLRDAPLLGRRQELRTFAESWDRACDGEGSSIALSGEPGIGKSRLAQAIAELCDEGDSSRVQLQCSPYHAFTPLYPFTQELVAAANFHPRDTAQQKFDKLERLLEATGGKQSALDLALFASLLSVPVPDNLRLPKLGPFGQKQETMRALADRLINLSRQRPLYWLFEDLHWADPSSLELVGMTLRRVPAQRIMFVMTHRTEFNPPWRRGFAQLALGRLDASFTSALVGAIAGPSLSAEMVARIAERTDGVPLFVEEVTHAVLERSSGDVGAGADQSVHGIPVPATLHDSLMARLDRSPAAREVAQHASAIGREFPLPLLERIFVGEATQLARGIRALAEAGLIAKRESTGPRTYVFKHALVQDTAYQSMLRRELRGLHDRIADALQEDVAAGIEVEDAELAGQLARAERHEQAAQAWSQAAGRSIARSNFAEAIAHSEAALALLDNLPAGELRDRRELDAQLTRGRSLLAARGWSANETGYAYQRARELSEKLNSEHAFTILYGLYTFYLVRGECHLSMEVANECLRRAALNSSESYKRLGQRWQGLTHLMLGECERARDVLLESLQDEDRERQFEVVRGYGTNPWSSTQIFLAHAEVILGKPNAAWRRAQASIRLAEELNDPFDLCHMLNWGAMVCIHRRDAATGAELMRRCLKLSQAHGLGLWIVAARVFVAIFDAELGDPEQAEQDFSHAIRAYEQGLGARHMVPLVRTEFARHMIAHGRLDRARTELELAQTVAEENHEGIAAAERERVFGELLQAEGDIDGAYQRYQRAHSISHRRNEHLIALRAAVSLLELRNNAAQDNLLEPHMKFVRADGMCADLQRAEAHLARADAL